MTRLQRHILALTSGVLLSTAWYEWGSPFLLFIAFLPFLLLEDDIAENGSKKGFWSLYGYGVIIILCWNILATWWIKNASYAGMFAELLVSGVFMSFPFMLYSMVKKKFGRMSGYASFVVFWLAFEFAFTYGEIAWPWLTLGNGFLFSIRFIQWYEITGVFGGSLWIVLVNVLLYEIVRSFRGGVVLSKQKGRIVSVALLLLIPVLISVIRYYTYEEIKNPREVVVVQPNIDAYMKFTDMPSIEQTKVQVDLAEKYVTDSTTWIVAPETSISGTIWIDRLDEVEDLQMVKGFTRQHPHTTYITGIMCFSMYEPFERTNTSKPLGNTGYYFDSYNSAIQMDTTSEIPIYHKSKLVTGVEKMPYTWLFAPLKNLMLELGGIFRTHRTQEEREVFTPVNDSLAIAPVICYESAFGEFVTDYIKLGAQYIFVITNDGWWGDTPGHRQHNALSSLRAIETRRSIARSANTGVSSIINQRGDVEQQLTWWVRDALRGTINANDKLTFYTKHGDYIGRAAFFLAIVLLVLVVVNPLVYRKKS